MRISKSMSAGIILTSLMFLLSGCAMFKYLDGSKDSEVLSFHTGEKVNAQGETESMVRKRIKTEQRAKQQISDEAKKRQQDKQRFSQERSTMQDEIGTLKNDIDQMERQIASLSMENKGFKETQKQEELQNVALSISIQKSKIKVLSGSGAIVSALAMAKRLESMGYNVANTGMAPTTEFPNYKVFYSKNNAAQAKRLAGQIGSNAVTAPLTWKSVYDIIVVTKNVNFYTDFPNAPR